MMIAQNSKGRLLEVSSYGKSMYGGWYADYREINSGVISGVRFNTLKEVCEYLNCSKTELISQVMRFDN